jgi:hypothetical protein
MWNTHRDNGPAKANPYTRSHITLDITPPQFSVHGLQKHFKWLNTTSAPFDTLSTITANPTVESSPQEPTKQPQMRCVIDGLI